jgi:hypothetical protein
MLVGDDVSSVRNAAGTILTASPPRPTFLSGLNKSVSYNRGLYADIHYRFWGLQRRCDRMIICGYGWGDTAISLQLESPAPPQAAGAHRPFLDHGDQPSKLARKRATGGHSAMAFGGLDVGPANRAGLTPLSG